MTTDKKLHDVASLLYAYYGKEYEANDQMVSRLACEIKNSLDYHEQLDEFIDVIDSHGAPKAAKTLFFDSQWEIDVTKGSGSLDIDY